MPGATNLLASYGSTSSFTTEYQAILNRGTALGYTLPSSGQQTKQNTYLAALKTAGIWTLLDVFYVFATDGSSDFATLNWKSPTTFQAVKTNSPTFTTNQGFKGDGVTAYVDTTFNPATSGVNYIQDNAGRVIWVFTGQSLGVAMDGVGTGTTNRSQNNSTTGQRINSSNNLSSAADLSGTGLKTIYRTSSTAIELFSNTTQISRTETSTSVTSQNQLVDKGGTVMGDAMISVYGLGASLVSQNTDLYNATNTYIGSL